MSCDDVRQLLSPLLDLQLRGEERDQALQHLASCRECSARAEELDEIRSAVRRMRDTTVPVRLVTQLRIDASKERQRRASRRSLSARIGAWASVARLSLDNLMRPMALP